MSATENRTRSPVKRILAIALAVVGREIRRIRVYGAILVAFLGLVVSGFSQTTVSTGGIQGTVTDPSGALVTGAIVSITNTATGQTASVKTNSAGAYTFAFLKPADYVVRIEARSFKTTRLPITVAFPQTQGPVRGWREGRPSPCCTRCVRGRLQLHEVRQLMRQVINKINEVDFNNLAEKQHFGDIYEQILNDLQSAGNAGEYYTPRAVTTFMAERIDPRPGEILLDPACGTGGFLTSAIKHMRDHYLKKVTLLAILDVLVLTSGVRIEADAVVCVFR
jgi:hypothetical protein